MVKSITRVFVVSLVVAWSFDFLFWRKPPGISFAIFIVLLTIGGLGLSQMEKRAPARLSLLLLLPLIFFTLMSFWRLEPFTTFINVLLSLIFLAILAITFRSGGWPRYGWADYAWRLLKLVGSAFSKPIEAWNWRLVRLRPEEFLKDSPPGVKYIIIKQRKKVTPVLRGLLLALPLLLVFGALLASADPIFAQGLEEFFQFLTIENLPEYLFRLTYILVIGYFLSGVYLHVLTISSDEKLIGVEKPLLPRFLGFTEAATVLVSVNLLFATFVGFQFRYFFGGQGNIHIAGYTYSEYARRGFSELVLVALFSLLLFLVLSTVAQRITTQQRTLFSILGAVLTLLVGVILVSAFQRLLLYEEAYGFSRLRTYTHVFIIWLGVLLASLLILELTDRLRSFTLASILVVIGFGITLNFLPVDGFIVKQNVLRAQAGADLDSAYLNSLSLDTVSGLWDIYHDPEFNESLLEQVGGVLACQKALNLPVDDLPWQGFNLTRSSAKRVLDSMDTELADYNVRKNTSGIWIVTIAHHTQSCLSTP